MTDGLTVDRQKSKEERFKTREYKSRTAEVAKEKEEQSGFLASLGMTILVFGAGTARAASRNGQRARKDDGAAERKAD